MIVCSRGEVKTWSDLTPGALFGVSISGETHLGLKIQGSGGEFHCAVLTGLPPHCVSENVVQNSLLYFLPKQQNSSSRLSACNLALMVRGHSRARSFRVPRDFSSSFREIKPQSRSRSRMEKFKGCITPM